MKAIVILLVMAIIYAVIGFSGKLDVLPFPEKWKGVLCEPKGKGPADPCSQIPPEQIPSFERWYYNQEGIILDYRDDMQKSWCQLRIISDSLSNLEDYYYKTRRSRFDKTDNTIYKNRKTKFEKYEYNIAKDCIYKIIKDFREKTNNQLLPFGSRDFTGSLCYFKNGIEMFSPSIVKFAYDEASSAAMNNLLYKKFVTGIDKEKKKLEELLK